LGLGENMPLSQKNKGQITLIGIGLFFFLPIITAWYLVFYTDFMINSKGVQHGNLIEPLVSIGKLEAAEIKTMDKALITEKWTLVFISQGDCKELCKERFYQLRQIRLALGEDRDKVDRLAIFNKPTNLEEFKESYSGQKFIDKNFQDYAGLIEKFKDFDLDKPDSIYLIDPYGFLMMQYFQDFEPKGIIKDIERLIKNSK
jgi:cytochrome oxidase Cu insertion factor (SCO1/SenC/PrrC family)